MSKSRIGKSLFPSPMPTESAQPTTPPALPPDPTGSTHTATTPPEPESTPAPEPTTSTGRPRKHNEPWKKVTVLLLSRNVLFLDRLSINIAERTDASMSRAEILRAMIEATEESGIDLSGVSSEEQLKTLLLDHLRR